MVSVSEFTNLDRSKTCSVYLIQYGFRNICRIITVFQTALILLDIFLPSGMN